METLPYGYQPYILLSFKTYIVGVYIYTSKSATNELSPVLLRSKTDARTIPTGHPNVPVRQSATCITTYTPCNLQPRAAKTPLESCRGYARDSKADKLDNLPQSQWGMLKILYESSAHSKSCCPSGRAINTSTRLIPRKKNTFSLWRLNTNHAEYFTFANFAKLGATREKKEKIRKRENSRAGIADQ